MADQDSTSSLRDDGLEIVSPFADKPFSRGTVVDYKGAHLTIGRVLGSGTTGTVTRGDLEHQSQAVPVVVKFANPGYHYDLQQERETFVAAGVTSIKGAELLRSVGTIQDPNTSKKAVVGLSSYIPGQTLRHQFTDSTQTPDAFVGHLAGIARTLHDAHRQGMAHLDVKADNTMLGHDGRTTVIDWGIARPIGSFQQYPSGTPHYMAPEVAAGKFHVSGKNDVFAVAMLGARFANGEQHRKHIDELPNPSDTEIYEAIQNHRSLPKVGDKLLGTILARAAHPDPQRRSSALDLMTDLAAYPQARAQYDAEDRELIVNHLIKRYTEVQGVGGRDVVIDATVARGLGPELPPNHPRAATIAAIAASSRGLPIAKPEPQVQHQALDAEGPSDHPSSGPSLS